MSEFGIEARWVLPMTPNREVLEEHTVVVAGDRITAILPTDRARTLFPALKCHRLDEHALLPGLVNAHTHAAMTLMRGVADDLPLMQWLENHIWPAEIAHVSPEFVHDGTLLAIAESMLGGVTCMNDMYFFPESAAKAALATGMRMTLGIIVIEFPTRYANDAQDYLARGLATRDALASNPLLTFCMAPHAPYTVSDDTLGRVTTLADQLDIPVHIHLHETAHEIQQSMAQHGCRPLERLARLGLLGPRLISVHSVHLEDPEIDALARHGCSIVHCPSSNMKLASGFARIPDLLDAGVNVALGTDGAASNNRLDLLEEVRLAALIAKGTSGRAEALPAWRALELATLGGAKALGLDTRIGTLEPGKQADLVAVDLSAIDLSPCFDPVSHLAYAASRRDVSNVWIAGSHCVTDHALTRIDVNQLKARVNHWHSLLSS